MAKGLHVASPAWPPLIRRPVAKASRTETCWIETGPPRPDQPQPAEPDEAPCPTRLFPSIASTPSWTAMSPRCSSTIRRGEMPSTSPCGRRCHRCSRRSRRTPTFASSSCAGPAGCRSPAAPYLGVQTLRATSCPGLGRRQPGRQRVALRRCRCCKPVIAMLRGFLASAAGWVSVSCDLRLAAQGCQFGIPAGRLGVGYPPGAMAYVVAAVGAMAAKDIFSPPGGSARTKPPRLGLFGRVVADADLERETLDLAATIAANAPRRLTALPSSRSPPPPACPAHPRPTSSTSRWPPASL